MNKPYGKRLELRHTREDGMQISQASIVANEIIEMSRGDALTWEKDKLKMDFGAALVDFLGIEFEESDWSYPVEDGDE